MDVSIKKGIVHREYEQYEHHFSSFGQFVDHISRPTKKGSPDAIRDDLTIDLYVRLATRCLEIGRPKTALKLVYGNMKERHRNKLFESVKLAHQHLVAALSGI